MSETRVPNLSADEIKDLLLEAAKSPRRRHPRILHGKGDVFNRVINVMLEDSYMQPHLHPDDKIEHIHLIKGQAAMLFFDDQGVVKQVVSLANGAAQHVEVPAFTWHTYVMLSDFVITYETMMGSYDPATWKTMAAWAPVENSPESGAYLDSLKARARSEASQQR